MNMGIMICSTLCEAVQTIDLHTVLSHTTVAWLWLAVLNEPSQFVSHGLWLRIVFQLSNSDLFNKLF